MRKTQGDILVLASKYVGLETVRFLLSIHAPIDRVIVADNTDPFNKKILALQKKSTIRFFLYNEHTQENLVKEKKPYNWLLNLWSPYILKPAVLSLVNHRLNIHSGLVPICRGNDNAAWCIRKNLPAGVALIEMNTDVDTGSVYIQQEVAYTRTTTGYQLHKKLQSTAIKLLTQNWSNIYNQVIVPKVQKGKILSFTRKQTEIDRVQVSTTTMKLENVIRWAMAHDFYPGTTAEVQYGDEIYGVRIKISKKKGK